MARTLIACITICLLPLTGSNLEATLKKKNIHRPSASSECTNCRSDSRSNDWFVTYSEPDHHKPSRHGKKRCMRGRRGPRGKTGHQGPKGDPGRPGTNGATGPQGLTGPQGSTGQQGLPGQKGDTGLAGTPGNFSGFAYGTTSEDEDITLSAIKLAVPLTDTTIYRAPLWHGTPLEGVPNVPFNFTPYKSGDDPATTTDAHYTINTRGRYLLQYGLTAAANTALVNDMTGGTYTVAAIVLQVRIDDQFGNVKQRLGGVPVALTHSIPSCCFQEMINGFGQISINLEEKDQVSLEIFIGSYNVQGSSDHSRQIMISHRIFESPFYPTQPTTPSSEQFQVTRGPTLTITKIGDVQPDTL